MYRLRHRCSSAFAPRIAPALLQVSGSGNIALQHQCRPLAHHNTPNADEEWDMEVTNAPPSLRHALHPSPSDLPESSLLKCIEKEITDEKLRLDKEEAPPSPPGDWTFFHCDGTSVFYGRRVWVPPPSESGAQRRLAEKHYIRAQLTTRDPSLDPECDIRGEHFPFSFFVQICLDEQQEPAWLSAAPPQGEQGKWFLEEEYSLYENSIEVRCDLIDGELRVDNVLLHGDVVPLGLQQRCIPGSSNESSPSKEEAPSRAKVIYCREFAGYEGLNLDEAEEDVLDGLQGWLAERCIDDLFAEFIGSYSVWVEQREYERWLEHLREYVAA